MIRYRTLLGAVLAVVATCGVAAELTLYEGENFQGRNLTLRNDMRDLDRTNFNDRAMSLVIRDGVWEVCKNPDIQEKLYDELRSEFPDPENDPITYKRALHLPYLVQ